MGKASKLHNLAKISILIVAYRPNPHDLSKIFARIIESKHTLPNISVSIIHNDQSLDSDAIQLLYQAATKAGLDISSHQASSNLGFGQGINRLAENCDSSLLLILNQDAIPEPNALEHLIDIATKSSPDIAAWEMRQIPYEHPKIYNPATMETPWASGAALLVRSAAFKEVGGFEPRIFMYGEDVDLSWKMRAKGWKILYVAKAAVVHETYEDPTKSKPLQVSGAIYAGLALRARYSGHREVLQAFLLALAELCLRRQEFYGRRQAISRAIQKFLGDYAYYRRTAPLMRSHDFEPYYSGWSYEERRIGAFHRFRSSTELGDKLPLVSVLIRTCGRPGMLRQAIQSVVNQTWTTLEVIVVEDGPGDAGLICKEFANTIPIKHYQHTLKVGRSAAGNTALSLASGEWLCFLDDDDLLFADHCEVLVETCLERKIKGAYGLAWRVFTDIEDGTTGSYREIYRDVFPYEPFRRLTMWEHNLFPIQAAVFHRSLYTRYGGLDTSMEQLEDWNLWVRYTLQDDFALVEKVTSCYRVPSQAEVNLKRQQNLDKAYKSVRGKHNNLSITMTLGELEEMLSSVANQNAAEKSLSRVKRFARNNSSMLSLYRKFRLALGVR